MNYEKQWGAKKFKISSEYCVQKITLMFPNKSFLMQTTAHIMTRFQNKTYSQNLIEFELYRKG